jgi:hypothetical protein
VRPRSPSRAGHRVVGLSAVGLALALALLGCTRIERPGTEEPPTGDSAVDLDPLPAPRLGDRLPDIPYRDASGRSRRLSSHSGHAVAITYLSGACLADGSCGDLVTRFATVTRTLREDLLPATAFVLVSTDPHRDVDRLDRSLPEDLAGASLDVAFADDPDLRALLDASGVVVWVTPDGAVRHNFETLVLDASLRIAHRFPGIEGWDAGDLRAAVAATAHGTTR